MKTLTQVQPEVCFMVGQNCAYGNCKFTPTRTQSGIDCIGLAWLVDILRGFSEIDIDLNDCLMDNMMTICAMSNGRIFPFHFTKWNSPLLAEALGMTYKEAMTWAYNNPGLQMMALPMPGAVEAMTALHDAGIKINIVTSTCLSASQIIAWLDTHAIPFDTIIKTKQKLDNVLLIDDNPKTLHERVEKGLPTWKIPKPWNKDVECPEMPSWSAITAAAEQLL